MKKNRKRIDPRYFLEETAIRDDLDDSLAPELEDEAAVPLPKVQTRNVEVKCSAARGGKATGQVRINPILDGGELVEYEVSTSPQDWLGARSCAFEAMQKVANELAKEGQRSGGPNVIDCDEDRIRVEMGYKPVGMCKVVIGNPAGQLRENMKITKQRLKQIIKEELRAVLKEGTAVVKGLNRGTEDYKSVTVEVDGEDVPIVQIYDELNDNHPEYSGWKNNVEPEGWDNFMTDQIHLAIEEWADMQGHRYELKEPEVEDFY